MMFYGKDAEQYRKMSNGGLATAFLRKYKREEIIGEVFRYFSVDCIERCKLDPNAVDALIAKFYANEEAQAYDALSSLIELLREPREQTEGQKLVDKIVSYVDTRLCENIKLEDVAKKFCISYHYMCHVVKMYTGTTLTSYRNKRRVLLAQRLLVETEKKVGEIAVECGFESISYFTEIFKKYTGEQPLKFREKQKDTVYLPWYYEEDMALATMLPSMKLLRQPEKIERDACVSTYQVHMPEDEYQFLHEAAIIEYHGTLFASWYNCPETELHGRTPIRGRRSKDGGKTWSEVEVVADCADGRILYCPPVYGICDDKLYLFLNELVGPDLVHGVDLFVFDEERMLLSSFGPDPFPLSSIPM